MDLVVVDPKTLEERLFLCEPRLRKSDPTRTVVGEMGGWVMVVLNQSPRRLQRGWILVIRETQRRRLPLPKNSPSAPRLRPPIPALNPTLHPKACYASSVGKERWSEE